MKKLLFLMLLLCSLSAWSQDVIVMRDGSKTLCNVIEVNDSTVMFRDWGVADSPIQAIDKKKVSRINYDVGEQEPMQQTQKQFTLAKQSNGELQYDDDALLKMQKVSEIPSLKKKAKVCKWAAIIGTPLLIGAGLVCLGDGGEFNNEFGSGILGLAAVNATLFIIRYNHYEKQIENLQGYSLMQEEFKFGDGSSLSAGVDLIKDNQFKTNTLGVGLRYTF